MTGLKPTKFLVLISALLAGVGAFSMQQPRKGAAPGSRETISAEATAAPTGGVKYNSGNHSDPFLNPNLLKKNLENQNEEEPRGQAPPGIAGMWIAQVKLLGTVYGEGTPTAIFLGTDQRSYFLQESDRLFDGYVKTIDADSVILVRETRFRSGKILTQEVTKRLRTPQGLPL
jgi:hypothetical protein